MRRNSNLTMAGHVREFKRRLLLCVVIFVALFISFYANAQTVTKWFLTIGKNAGFALGYIAPQEMLLQSLRVCGTLALLVSLPLIIWQVGAYVMPAVGSKKGRVVFSVATIAAIVLFFLGLLFCIKILFPFIFQYLHSYSEEFGVDGYVSVDAYLSLFITTAWIMGLLFEVPLVSAAFSSCGILTAKMMKKALKPAIVVIAFIAAMITPPDVISMAIVGIPMIGIYVLSIGVCKVCQSKGKEKRVEN